MTDLLLHQFQVSPFAAKVRRALRYKGLSFKVRNYGVAQAGEIRRTVSPTGKTPVLEHAGKRIVDSSAILRYLDEHLPGAKLLPADPLLRAQAHIIEDWADESLFFYDLAMRCWPNNIDWLIRDVLSHDQGLRRWLLARVMPPVFRKMAAGQGIARKDRDTICAEVAVHFDSIVALLSRGEYLVGNTLSVADIGVAAMCTVMERAEEGAAMMRARPVLQAWRERVDAATLPAQTAPEDRAII